MTDIHTYNNLTQGHVVGHYAAVTANGAGLLPGAGGGRSMVVVAADVVAVVEVQPSIK